jgi:hypothetical protein
MFRSTENRPSNSSRAGHQKRGIIVTVTVERVAIIAAALLVAIVAFAYGMSDDVAAALPMIDAGPAGSVIWD